MSRPLTTGRNAAKALRKVAQIVMNLETYTLPSHWASYLVNDDASSMEDDEQMECDEWMEATFPNGAHCVNVGESEFSHRNDANNLGGDVAEFTFDVNPSPGLAHNINTIDRTKAEHLK